MHQESRSTTDNGQILGREVEFLGKTISPDGVAPQAHKIKNYLEKIRFAKSKKALQRYLGFVNYYRNYIPRLSEKTAPFHELLKKDNQTTIQPETVEKFKAINKALDNAC